MDTLLNDALSEVGYVVGMTAEHYEEKGGVDFVGLMDDLESVVRKHIGRAQVLAEVDAKQKAPEGA